MTEQHEPSTWAMETARDVLLAHDLDITHFPAECALVIERAVEQRVADALAEREAANTCPKEANMTEKLLPCPFCGTQPHHGLGKVQYCQLHGDPYQNFSVWCPHNCAKKTAADRVRAITAWNTRAKIGESND